MTNLIQHLQTNNSLPNVQSAPKWNQNNIRQNQMQSGLSPEAKSTLWSGLMCGVLGGVWAAPPKYNAVELINLKQDTFTKETKNVQKTVPEAFSSFTEIRNQINNELEDNLNYFFGDKSEISKQSLLKKLNEANEEALEASVGKMTQSIQKIQSIDLDTLLGQTSDYKKLTKEQLETLKASIGDELFKEISEQKPTDIKNFLTNKIKVFNRKNFGLLLCDTATDGQIFKEHAEKFTSNKLLDSFAEIIKETYNNISSKLPKKRLKTAARWFGMGLGISILMNAIFGAIRNAKSRK